MSFKGSTATPTNGKKCDSWSWAAIILVIVVIAVIGFGCWGTLTESGKATFTNLKNRFGNTTSGPSIKDLDIVMFMSPTCPWCKKMIGVLEKEGQIRNLTIVDMTKPEGAAIAKQFGADKQPVPSFISRRLKTGTVGYRETVAKLVDSLKPQPKQVGGSSSSEEPGMGGMQGGGGGGLVELIQGLQIVLFAREGCPWCTKAKEACAQAGVMDAIQVVDITSPEGAQMAGQMLPPGSSGVPAWVSMATKKSVVGFKPIDALVQELQ